MVETLRESALAKARCLPVMSTAAVQMLSLLRDPASDAARFERAIRYDPGLTCKLLKMANSAYFGCPGKIGSIRQAVVRLGWNRVYQLVVASSVSAAMDSPVAGYDLPKGNLWRHSVAVAVASENLMHQIGKPMPEEAFTAALLHDIGKLIVGDLIAAKFDQFMGLVSRRVPLEIAEQQVLGVDHAEVGAMVLKTWSFPDMLIEAVRWHHEPDTLTSHSARADLVHVANILCLTIGIGRQQSEIQHMPSEDSMERLGLKTEHLAATAESIVGDIEELAQSL